MIEDRQDGVGESAASVSTLGQASRNSFSEQARLLEERPCININHRILQSFLALMRTVIKYTLLNNKYL